MNSGCPFVPPVSGVPSMGGGGGGVIFIWNSLIGTQGEGELFPLFFLVPVTRNQS